MLATSGFLSSRLAPLIDRQAVRHGADLPIPGLTVSRFDHPSQPLGAVQHPVFSVVVQGVKAAMIGGTLIRYTAGNCLVTCVDLPVSSHIVEASPARPYLAVSLALDPRLIHDLAGERLVELPDLQVSTPFGVGALDPRLVDPLTRLLELVDDTGAIPVLAPLVTREIAWRLLQGPFATLLRQAARPDGNLSRIARATRWIRDNAASPLSVPELAAHVHMSAPSLHRHFRAVTSVSPLQFQKQVRLHEARLRLLASEGVAHAAFAVGYESLSQFNRDYRKLYGRPPTQDVAALRQDIQEAGAAP